MESQQAVIDHLFHPLILLHCDFKTLNEIVVLCKFGRQRLIGEGKTTSGYWQAVCSSFCSKFGLYSLAILNPSAILHIDYHQHFLKTLLPLRSKWETYQDQQIHKIKVACRFRPGEPPSGKVCLPLHQFIKVRRQQQQREQDGNKDKSQNGQSTKIFVGEEDPEEFKDPFLGGLMRDPVLLTTSNRIVSRAVALQCILRGGRDPFNNKKLAANMLIPQPELAVRIQEWRNKIAQRDVSIDIKDAKGLVDCSAFDEECFDALLDLQRLHQAAKKAMLDANNPQQWNEEHPVGEAAPEMNAPHPEHPEVNGDAVENPGQLAEDLWSMDVTNPVQTIINEEDELYHRNHYKANEVARIVEVNRQNAFVSMHVPGAGVQPFHFHTVHDSSSNQKDIYEKSIHDAIEAALNGCNACILCYGQTGSGKTFTYLGPQGHLDDSDLQEVCSSSQPTNDFARGLQIDYNTGMLALPEASGIVLRAAQEIFAAKDALKSLQIEMHCTLQIVEIYEEKLTDLLTGNPVTVRRESGLLQGASEVMCSSLQELLPILKQAHSRQRFAETAMNQRSSRAHTVLIWHITQRRPLPKNQNSPDGSAVEYSVVESHLHLVDLAGSERVKKSQVTGQRLREAVGINSSLLVLGKVITALEEQRHHVPYLESKLTTLLRAAFGGNSRTMVMINARSDEEHGDETLQSIRFGWRCSNISNQLKTKAMSLEATIEAIDHAIRNVEQQLHAMQRLGRQQLESYKVLEQSLSMMQVKRRELLASHGNPVITQKAHPTVEKPKPRPHYQQESYL